MRLPPPKAHILTAMVLGSTLKSHRTMDGEKIHKLHALSSGEEPVDSRIVEQLVEAGILRSNMKFPVATYLLTERGMNVAISHGKGERQPVTVRGFGSD